MGKGQKEKRQEAWARRCSLYPLVSRLSSRIGGEIWRLQAANIQNSLRDKRYWNHENGPGRRGCAIPVGAVLGAGVISAGAGVYSANKAAKAQEKASKKATDTTLKMYEQTRADLQPYAGTGVSSLDSIAAMYGLKSPGNPTGKQAFGESELEAFRNSPDYKVALEEGIRARDLSAASKGNLLSGGQEKRIAEYGSELASLKFGQYMDKLFKLSGMGQNAAAGQGAAAQSAGSSLANLALGTGEAQASGYVGAGNAISDAASGIGSNLAFYAMRNPSAYKAPATIY